ncbi:hypothetical protein TNCV_3665801 [Trichonephila clavipes]|nr:hypothetical protein TNCV_3665801 [Trichonephila clavipes]
MVQKPFSVNRFLANKNIPVAPQPPYSPDLSPCDFFPLSEIEESPQGTSFWDTGKHSNGCNRPAEGYSNIHFTSAIRSGRNVSSAVGFRRQLL